MRLVTIRNWMIVCFAVLVILMIGGSRDGVILTHKWIGPEWWSYLFDKLSWLVGERL